MASMNSDIWTWARCLAEEGITLRLVGDKLISDVAITDPDVIEFIRKNRDAIVAEYKGRDAAD